MENIIDLGTLSTPRPEIELKDEEARALLSSPRCPKCDHLGVFHYWEGVELGTISQYLTCKFCKEPCAIE